MKGTQILDGYAKPISRKTIESAISLFKTKAFRSCPMYANLTIQLAYSLEIYASRGEFNGNYDEAVECFKQAEYEIESEDAK